MNIVKSIWSAINKVWNLFMTVLAPAMKNKEVVEETVSSFAKMLAEKYPNLFDQIMKATDKCAGMSDKLVDMSDKFVGMSGKVDKLQEMFFALRDELHAARLISCKAAPTCKNVIK
jgi:hypothetical protein